MPIKLNIQPSAKGAGSPTPVPPPARSTVPAQTGMGSSSTMASYPPQSPSSSLPHSSQQKKAAPPRNNPQPPVLPPLSTMTTNPPSSIRQPESLSDLALAHQQQPFEEDEIQAPPYSPITPPSATTPPPMPESNGNAGPSSSPIAAPSKTVTHIPPPVIPPNFASMGTRAPLTHNAHLAAVATAAPPPLEPIDFENNPDVIALQATIGILLRQQKQAEASIRQLKDAKNAAIQRPMDFYEDLVGGRVSQGPMETKHEEDDDDDIDDDVDVEMKTEDDGANTMLNGLKPSAMGVKAPKERKGEDKGKGKATASSSSSQKGPSAATPAPWTNLPEAQDIVRMPPINWAQYAVEGEAFNKVHNNQLTHPTRGTPAVIGTDGTYEFTGAANPDDGKKVDGISAPFNPLRDRVEEKKPARGGAAGGSRRGA